MAARVLVIGGGGREHALARKLSQSPDVQHVYVAPGNAGTNRPENTSNIDLDVKDHSLVINWCRKNQISTVVVGPEAPLAEGISDTLNKNGIACFGPSAKASEIESSKEFAKSFMSRWEIPTARWKSFTSHAEAKEYINSAPFPALVVKASGLAAGKGVVIGKDRTEACRVAGEILENALFGSAGSTIVVEELLEGEEISCLAFTDGTTVQVLPPVQDHKRLYEGDRGPNTGGMGAYCPCPLVSEEELEFIKTGIIQKAVDGLRQAGRVYKGLLYAGLMLTKEGPKVLEFNCRFGDPETQVLLPLMTSDLYKVITSCIHGNLASVTPEFHNNKTAVAVVTVSQGYPDKYDKGMEITNIKDVESMSDMKVFHAGTKVSDSAVVTNGGRVLAVVAMDTDLSRAARHAQMGAEIIKYKGKEYRRDIGLRGLNRSLTYSSTGVSLAAGDAVVHSIRDVAALTSRPGCMAGLGMFGAAYDLNKDGYRDPVLVSGTDGVGTKLKIAQACNIHSTIGADLVAMCVNDILCHGAEPLFFLDYFACGKLEVGVASEVIKGIAKGCKEAGCALVGGETAEMPGMYTSDEYDLAGFSVGAVERDDYLPQAHKIYHGDHVIGIAASGVHSNGYSLVRKVVDLKGLKYDDKCPFQEDKTLGEVLLTPTQIYVKPVLSLLKSTKVKAIAHITGGGLPGNICRVLPERCGVTLDANKWDVPAVFGWIASEGNVACDEMARTFNCGVGMVLVVDRQESPQVVCDRLRSLGCVSWVIGNMRPITQGEEKIEIVNLREALQKSGQCSPTLNSSLGAHTNGNSHSVDINGTSNSEIIPKKKKVAVLISGSGTNLKALLDHTQDPLNSASSEICLVISNKAGVKGLMIAENAGVQTKVVSHKEYKTREMFDEAVHTLLIAARIDIVCLAGFMRILTGGFVRKWDGRMLNIHPSLLPSFKGGNAHELVIKSKVRISGCTVHFVAEEVDGGAILVQESVPVYPTDTEQSLADRVKVVEHRAFPQALELVASGRATLGPDGAIVWAEI